VNYSFKRFNSVILRKFVEVTYIKIQVPKHYAKLSMKLVFTPSHKMLLEDSTLNIGSLGSTPPTTLVTIVRLLVEIYPST
jgi:hypothetical protein